MHGPVKGRETRWGWKDKKVIVLPKKSLWSKTSQHAVILDFSCSRVIFICFHFYLVSVHLRKIKIYENLLRCFIYLLSPLVTNVKSYTTSLSEFRTRDKLLLSSNSISQELVIEEMQPTLIDTKYCQSMTLHSLSKELFVTAKVSVICTTIVKKAQA